MRILFLILLTASIATAQSKAYWQYKQKDGLETYTKYKMGWPFKNTCATYSTGNPVKSSTVKRFHDRRKQHYLRNQKLKRFVKRFKYESRR